MSEEYSRKRGPKKKPGYRQELRVTPAVEAAFNALKDEFKLKNNSEALNKIAEIFLHKYEEIS